MWCDHESNSIFFLSEESNSICIKNKREICVGGTYASRIVNDGITKLRKWLVVKWIKYAVIIVRCLKKTK